MGFYKYMREAWKKPRENLKEMTRQRLIQWRQEPVSLRIEHPTRIDRARSLGYKAKPGYIIVRQRVIRSRRLRPQIRAGRKSKRMSRRKDLGISYQEIAERRAVKKYPNCEVLNSYWVIEDARHKWYEIILVDKQHPSILADSRISWIAESQHRRRVFRGLTASGKRSRGILTHKGKGAEKLRPSRRAHNRIGV